MVVIMLQVPGGSFGTIRMLKTEGRRLRLRDEEKNMKRNWNIRRRIRNIGC
jgi:hypothetical protein